MPASAGWISPVEWRVGKRNRVTRADFWHYVMA